MLITIGSLHGTPFILNSICIVFVLMAVSKVTEACGSYIKIAKGGQYTLTSGSNYGTYQNCIWLIETDAEYILSMALTFEGDMNYDICGDYVTVEDGYDAVLFDGQSQCTGTVTETVSAPASWMRVQFKSDGANTTNGFQGIISSIHVGANISDIINPIQNCRSYQWSCPNKVCMTLSYRCDGFNDCGCEGDGCDESGCDGLPIGKYTVMVIGGCVGFAIFIVFFVFAYLYEAHLRRKALMADPEAQAELQRKKAEQKRREAYKKAAKEKKGRS